VTRIRDHLDEVDTTAICDVAKGTRAATAEQTVAAAREVKATEARIIARLEQGATLSDCLDIAEHAQRLARGEPSTLGFTG
jgi:hypothetical protein